MYLLIFTCLNIRTSHIELIEDRTLHLFVLSVHTICTEFQNYINNDYTKTFLAAGKLLEDVFVSNAYTASLGPII